MSDCPSIGPPVRRPVRFKRFSLIYAKARNFGGGGDVEEREKEKGGVRWAGERMTIDEGRGDASDVWRDQTCLFAFCIRKEFLKASSYVSVT